MFVNNSWSVFGFGFILFFPVISNLILFQCKLLPGLVLVFLVRPTAFPPSLVYCLRRLISAFNMRQTHCSHGSISNNNAGGAISIDRGHEAIYKLKLKPEFRQVGSKPTNLLLSQRFLPRTSADFLLLFFSPFAFPLFHLAPFRFRFVNNLF